MKVGVVGIGYIGGSIIKALAIKGISVVGITCDIQHTSFLNGPNCTISENIKDLKECDFVFICMELNKTLKIADKLKDILSNDCIVTDIHEVKEVLLKKEHPYSFIGSHPLVDMNKHGVKASTASLFTNVKWAVVPRENESKEKINKLQSLIVLMGGVPFIIDAKKHDELMAKTCHLPVIIAQALIKTMINNKDAYKLRTEIFKDIAKCISINPSFAKNNLLNNKENIDNAIFEFEKALSELKNSKEKYLSKSLEIKNSYNKISDEIERKEKFEAIFKQNYWGSSESISGPASDLVRTVHLREVLPKIISFKNVKSIVDVPCGDMNWFSTIDIKGIKYWGFDIVEELIQRHKEAFKNKPNYEFAVKDAITDKLPKADLILCRDLIIHFPIMAVYDLLQNFIKSGSKYLLITQHTMTTAACKINSEINFGEFAFRNLTEPPFNLPQPELLIPEDQYDTRCIRYMALYEMKEIEKALNSR